MNCRVLDSKRVPGPCKRQKRQGVDIPAPTGEVFSLEPQQLRLEASSQEEQSASSKNSEEAHRLGRREGVGELILNQTAFNASQELVTQLDLAGPRRVSRPGANSEVAGLQDTPKREVQ